MMSDDALPVCSELLTVSVSPIPSIQGLEEIEGIWRKKR